MTDSRSLTSIAQALLGALPDDPAQRITVLSEAAQAVSDALSEALAEGLIAGMSQRQVASAAGIAPNTVSPRLLRSASMTAYATEQGRIGAPEVARARYDHAQASKPPMKFVPRKKESS